MDLHNAEEKNSHRSSADEAVDSVTRGSSRRRSLLKGLVGWLSARGLCGRKELKSSRIPAIDP